MSQNFVTYWKEKRDILRQRNRALAQYARRDVEQITQMLRENYHVKRIILFGSLAKGQFTGESDIDLAVEGLASTEFFTAYADVNRLSRFRVDLKPLEELHPHFCQRVLAQGETIYEASHPC